MPADINNSNAMPEDMVNPEGEQSLESTVDETSAQEEMQVEQQKPLTLEDYRAIARQEAMRIARSQVGKSENRIQKMIQSKFAALEQMKDTVGLTPEQVSAAKQKIVADAYSTSDEQPEVEQQTNQQQMPDVDAQIEAAIQIMNTGIQSVFKKVGSVVVPSDPEFKALQAAVDASWNDPDGYAAILLAASKAATAKATRVAALNKNASARTVGSGGKTSGNVPMTTDQIKADLRARRARGEKV